MPTYHVPNAYQQVSTLTRKKQREEKTEHDVTKDIGDVRSSSTAGRKESSRRWQKTV
jgi:hypothetical protein